MADHTVTQHTPGPWAATVEQHDSFGDLPRWWIRGSEIGRTRPIVTVVSDRGDGEEIESNARLIAAAPELLEAVRAFIALQPVLLEGEGPVCQKGRVLLDINVSDLMKAYEIGASAIAKAEGR